MEEQPAIGLDEVVAVHSGPTSLHHSLGHIIRGKIHGREWIPGQRIPSEREMMRIFNISRATVRQGIDNLVKEGILQRVQGKGTFVAPPKIEQGVLRLMEFSDVIKRNGLKPRSRLVAKQQIEPPPNVRRLLALSESEEVAWFQRLLLVNEAPILLETSYFSAIRFPDLLAAYDGIEAPHLFVYQRYGLKMARARETFEPVILEEWEGELLGSEGGFPALWVEHVAYDTAEKPVAYLTSLMRGDRCRFYTDLAFD
jgi:GntR family transcriptional regulator